MTDAPPLRPSRPGLNELEVVDLRALLALNYPATRWRIDDLLPAQGVAVLGGLPKAGKSFLSNQQALCIAAGIPFLGQRTEQGRVLLIEAEGSPAAFQDRLRRQSEALGIHGSVPLFAPKEERRLRLGTDEGRDRLDAAIRKWRPDVVILGPLAQLYPLSDENSASEMGRVVGHLLEVSQGHGIVIQLAHHFRKSANPGANEASWFDGLRGSNALEAGCDAMLGLVRLGGRWAAKGSGKLVSRQRNAEGSTIPYRFDPDSWLFVRSDLPAGPSDDGGDPAPRRVRTEHPDDEYCEMALQAFRADPSTAWSARSIADRLGVSKNTARPHLEALVGQGLASKRRVGRAYLYGLAEIGHHL